MSTTAPIFTPSAPAALIPLVQLNTIPPTPPATDMHAQNGGAPSDATFLSMSAEEKRGFSWQYHGYPAFARHMASSHDFFLLRRYAPLQARCLLFLQNEIGMLEKRLVAWDEFAMKNMPGKGDSGSMSNDQFPERTVIIRQLLPLFKEYNELADSFAKIRVKPTAVKSQLTNLNNWFTTYPDAVAPMERHWEGQEGDLFPLVARPKNALATFFAQSRVLKRIFKTGWRTDHVDAGLANHWSATAFEVFTTTVILILGLVLLFAPVWWLNFVSTNNYRLAIVTSFSALFTASLWLAAGNKPFEILGATAAYTAVLMIYRQLGNS